MCNQAPRNFCVCIKQPDCVVCELISINRHTRIVYVHLVLVVLINYFIILFENPVYAVCQLHYTLWC